MLPIGLVFLDKWVTGNQITGDWRWLDSRNASTIVWESHREHKGIQILLLGNKRLHFSGQFDILQRENRRHGLQMDNQYTLALIMALQTVLTEHTEGTAISTYSKRITRKPRKDLAKVTTFQ